jgi:hypothetical protein
VWFVPNSQTFLHSIEELEQRLKLTPIKTERDGVIYDVEPKVAGPKSNCPNR